MRCERCGNELPDQIRLEEVRSPRYLDVEDANERCGRCYWMRGQPQQLFDAGYIRKLTLKACLKTEEEAARWLRAHGVDSGFPIRLWERWAAVEAEGSWDPDVYCVNWTRYLPLGVSWDDAQPLSAKRGIPPEKFKTTLWHVNDALKAAMAAEGWNEDPQRSYQRKEEAKETVKEIAGNAAATVGAFALVPAAAVLAGLGGALFFGALILLGHACGTA